MHKLVFGSAVPFHVVEGDGVSLDSNFLEKIGELTPSSLACIAEETVLELAGLLHFRVGA